MNSNTFIKLHCNLFRRYTTTAPKIKIKVIPDEKVLNDIKNEVIKFREHPGAFKPRTIILPDTFIKAIVNTVEDEPIKTLLAEAKNFSNHLRAKAPPLEASEMKEITNRVKEKAIHKYRNVPVNSEADQMKYKQMVENKTKDILRKSVYNWNAIEYNHHNSLVYLFARSAPEYAVLARIFGEINKRDPEFKPQSLFDFGSGVGTVTWAANLYWKKHFFEYFNVDASSHMNDLALTLLQGGRGTNTLQIKGVFFRQFLPSTNRPYDLVVSAYSLLELPSQETRLKTILNLWNKTTKYLVIVEQGTNSGFKVINEARDFILNIKHEKSKGHVFSPCAHDEICPRYILNDGTPCNFEIGYFTLPISANSEKRSEMFSYVILKKGKREETDLQWPRVVRQPLVRAKHTICRMCTASGKISEVIFTASRHGKLTYYCARSAKCGDMLPITLDEQSIVDSDNVNKAD